MGLSSLKWEILPLLRIWDNIGVGNSEKISIEKGKNKKGAPSGALLPRDQKILVYSTLILISFLLASSDFGSAILKTPFLKEAVILLLWTFLGIWTERVKDP